jgi:hypothetical protein
LVPPIVYEEEERGERSKEGGKKETRVKASEKK